MKSTKTVQEAYVFLGLTLALSYFVFWGPLALFKIPAISVTFAQSDRES